MTIHPMARTTAQLRAEIHGSPLTNTALAEKYDVTKATVRKWRQRESFEDKSHCPDRLQTTLSVEQELLVVEQRKLLFLPLDDLLVITRKFIHGGANRSGIARTLKRHGVASPNTMRRELEEAAGEKVPLNSFKKYKPGFIHIDVKYLPQMADKKHRRYLFVAIDRATRWVHLAVCSSKTAANARSFLKEVAKRPPFKIDKLLTDNGKEFTDRLFRKNKERAPTGQHVFDRKCAELGIERRLSKPRSPQTNGMVERFNGRLSGLLKDTRLESWAHLESVLKDYLQIYNCHIPQKNLGHLPPIQAMKEWQLREPDLLHKAVYDLSGLDS